MSLKVFVSFLPQLGHEIFNAPLSIALFTAFLNFRSKSLGLKLIAVAFVCRQYGNNRNNGKYTPAPTSRQSLSHLIKDNPMTTAPTRRLGTTNEAAAIANVSKRTILNWMNDDDFGHYESKNKHEWLIDLDDLENYLMRIRSKKRRPMQSTA